MEWTTPLVWAVAVPSLALVRPLTTRLTMSYNDCVRLWVISPARLALHLLGRAATAAFVWGWPFVAFAGRGYPLSTTLLFSLAPYPVFSLWFMLCSQINHHSIETSEAHNANWYRHQVLTSQDVAPQSFLAFLISGGLNLQIEHHLFPTINHWHLRALQPKVRACACARPEHLRVRSRDLSTLSKAQLRASPSITVAPALVARRRSRRSARSTACTTPSARASPRPWARSGRTCTSSPTPMRARRAACRSGPRFFLARRSRRPRSEARVRI